MKQDCVGNGEFPPGAVPCPWVSFFRQNFNKKGSPGLVRQCAGDAMPNRLEQTPCLSHECQSTMQNRRLGKAERGDKAPSCSCKSNGRASLLRFAVKSHFLYLRRCADAAVAGAVRRNHLLKPRMRNTSKLITSGPVRAPGIRNFSADHFVCSFEFSLVRGLTAEDQRAHPGSILLNHDIRTL